VREISVCSYRILYEVMPPDERICILAVVHKRRDFDPADIGR
jgi:mRNA-degrading endonuclease RelE of RelBE toxin-antitoxin system